MEEILPRQKYIKYTCLCDCGTKIEIIKSNLKNGTTNSCGCLRDEASKENIKKSHEARVIYKPQDLSSQRVWERRYSDGDLTLEEFRLLSQNLCWYCNASPSNTANWYKGDKRSNQSRIDAANFIYNGLDRVDNSLPHNKNNLVCCCFDCNKAKMEMTLKDFKDHIIKLILSRVINYSNSLLNIKASVLLGKSFPVIIKVGKRKYLPEIATARTLWINAGYKREGLSFEAFYELSQMPCIYCGIKQSNSLNPPSRKTDVPFIYNGIDRLDSSKEHIIGNLVPSCWNCNRMKSNRSLTEFDKWITNINNNWINKDNMTDIAKDFDELAKQINAKINEAADALKAANKLAHEAGMPTLHMGPYAGDYYSKNQRNEIAELADRISFDNLMNELEEAGWSTSSMDC